MEKVGLAICYVGVGVFYGSLAWTLFKFTKAALPKKAEQAAEPAPEAEPVPAAS